MLHAVVFERLVQKHPEAVMVRATLEQALPASLVDEVFERVASRQYTRKLLFSTLVALLSTVVCRARRSVHAAIVSMEGQLNVIAKSVYNKLNGVETAVSEALLREAATRMAAVVDQLDAPLTPLIPGWKTRILDGNHLAATEHRLESLRTIGGGALPGVALAVYDAERGLVDRVYLCRDAHAQERELVVELLGEMGSGEAWIADRNFATALFMLQTHANGSRFIVRRHKTKGCDPLNPANERRKTLRMRRNWRGVQVVLLKTAFLREAVVDFRHRSRKERRDAGRYHCLARFVKSGQVDELEPAVAALSCRVANRQAGRRFPRRPAVCGCDGALRMGIATAAAYCRPRDRAVDTEPLGAQAASRPAARRVLGS